MGKSRAPFHTEPAKKGCAVTHTDDNCHWCYVCLTEFQPLQQVVCPHFLHEQKSKEKDKNGPRTEKR